MTWTKVENNNPADFDRIDIPAAPLLISPADGAIDQEITLTLTWQDGSFPYCNAWHFQLSDNAAFEGEMIFEIENWEDKSISVTGLDGNKTYYWRVAAKDRCWSKGGVELDGKESAWSDTFTFTTKIPYDEEAVWDSRIVKSGSHISSDGTDGYFFRSDFTMLKVKPAGVETEIPIDVAVNYVVWDSVHSCFWISGVDWEYNPAFGKLSTGGVFTSVSIPADKHCIGLLFDGVDCWFFSSDNNLWISQIYKVSYDDGFESEPFVNFDDLYNFTEADWDGSNGWCIADSSKKIFKITSGGIVTSSDLLSEPYRMVRKDTDYYVSGTDEPYCIMKIDESGNVSSFVSLTADSRGLGCDGNDLWLGSLDDDKVKAIRADGSTLDYDLGLPAPVPPEEYGVTDIKYFNGHLWISYELTSPLS